MQTAICWGGGYALRHCCVLAASASLSAYACCAGDDEVAVVFLDSFVAAHGQECGQSRCSHSLRFPAVPGGIESTRHSLPLFKTPAYSLTKCGQAKVGEDWRRQQTGLSKFLSTAYSRCHAQSGETETS